MMFGLEALAQEARVGKETPVSVDVALTYAAERGQLAPSNCDCFWMNGAGLDAAVNFRRGFGLVASISGSTASNVTSGVDVNRIVYLVGERFTHALHNGPNANAARKLDFFGQWLVGGVHGFDGVYPATGGVTATANGYALQLGGGLNLALNNHLGLRLLDAEYLYTTLPNNASDTQNDLRLSAGVSYRFGKL
jgi:hypothetical protein